MQLALSGLRGAGLVALVDDVDYALLATKRWYLHSDGYAVARGGIYMHRVVLGMVDASHREQVDHINCNKLDNRRANLRRATPAQNAVRRSEGKLAGIHEAGPERWAVTVGKQGRGCKTFTIIGTKEEAIAARNAHLLERYGAAFAPTMPTSATDFRVARRSTRPAPRNCVDCGKQLHAKSGEPNRVARNPTPRCRACDSRAKCSVMNARRSA